MNQTPSPTADDSSAATASPRAGGANFAHWLEAARPHTWANAFATVIGGTGAAFALGHADGGRALLAAFVAWALIVGVNYANDYSDGIRGTDDDRQGPFRLTSSKLVPAQWVKYAAFISFGFAGLAGLVLSIASGHPWLIIIGIICVLAAWFYTGGSHPYGYNGLGEVAVFIFFGLVAVLGTTYTQAGVVSGTAVGIACAIGSLSAAVNLVNNLRDIPSDSETGKITLAVRLGDQRTRILWGALATVPLLVTIGLLSVSPWALAALVATPLLIGAAQPVIGNEKGPALIPVLGQTGKAMIIWATITAVALI